MSSRSPRHRFAPTFAAVVLVLGAGAGLAACGGDDEGTTTVEPSTTETKGAETTTTLLANQEAIDAMVQTWMQAGFTEEQATCLVEQMNEVSSQIDSTDPDALSAGDQNLIEQMMTTCNLDDEALSSLGGS